MVGWYGTRDQVLFLSKTFISVSISWHRLGSLEACVKHVGSIGAVTKLPMRQIGMGYRVARQTFGVLLLLGGELGEPEDENDEKDSSAGAGGGVGEGVCDGGGSGGGARMRRGDWNNGR